MYYAGPCVGVVAAEDAAYDFCLFGSVWWVASFVPLVDFDWDWYDFVECVRDAVPGGEVEVVFVCVGVVEIV